MKTTRQKRTTVKYNDDGYTCSCGVTHKYPAYVYAHWDVELTHKCECGKQYFVQSGVVQEK